MNVIVKKHYPVEKLPPDLREGLGSTELVTVEIAVEDDEDVGQRPIPAKEAVALMRQMQLENLGKGITEDEAVRRIRELRDDRDAS